MECMDCAWLTLASLPCTCKGGKNYTIITDCAIYGHACALFFLHSGKVRKTWWNRVNLSENQTETGARNAMINFHLDIACKCWQRQAFWIQQCQPKYMLLTKVNVHKVFCFCSTEPQIQVRLIQRKWKPHPICTHCHHPGGVMECTHSY